MSIVTLILSESIKGLGQKGEVVKVKRGYAENFLIREKKASIATKLELIKIKNVKIEEEKSKEELRKNADSIIKKVDGKTVKFEVATSSKGKLYGSVTENEIIAKLKEEYSFELPSHSMILTKSLKEIGDHEVEINIIDDKKAKIIVSIVKK